MLLNLLCIGDVVGGPGRRILESSLPQLISSHKTNCVIVNGENAAAGSGLTAQLYQKIIACGADVITLGDHVYKRKEIIPILEQSDRIIRPANLSAHAPGREVTIRETAAGHRVAVVSLLGRLNMRMPADCPFAAIDRILKALPSDVKVIVVEIHAEATSEKVAMGWYLDGRVSVVFGTHTHIPTADERVLPKGTAYITDLGMTGPYDSVLGRLKDRVISSMTTSVPSPFDVASDDVRLCGILARVDSMTGHATHVERVRVNESKNP